MSDETSPIAPADQDAPQAFAFLGAKGGCGTTTLVANLACVAAREATVAAADFDFFRGDLALTLDLSPDAHLAQIVGLDGPVDGVAIRGAAVSHVGGFDALCQPTELHHLAAPDADHIRQAIGQLRAQWDRVLLDLGSRLDVASLTSLVEVDRIVLVTSNDVPALQNAQRILRLLEELAIPLSTVRLVVCPWDPKALTAEEVESHLQLRIAAIVRRDAPTQSEATLHGRLASEFLPNRPLAQDARQAWGAVRGAPVPLVKPPRPLWPWRR